MNFFKCSRGVCNLLWVADQMFTPTSIKWLLHKDGHLSDIHYALCHVCNPHVIIHTFFRFISIIRKYHKSCKVHIYLNDLYSDLLLFIECAQQFCSCSYKNNKIYFEKYMRFTFWVDVVPSTWKNNQHRRNDKTMYTSVPSVCIQS